MQMDKKTRGAGDEEEEEEEASALFYVLAGCVPVRVLSMSRKVSCLLRTCTFLFYLIHYLLPQVALPTGPRYTVCTKVLRYCRYTCRWWHCEIKHTNDQQDGI